MSKLKSLCVFVVAFITACSLAACVIALAILAGRLALLAGIGYL